MQPKVSIIVPCWGVEKYLDRCVESLVGQTLQEIEIILVDDESPDLTPEMCDNWARKDARIRVVHKKNGGLGMACNSGIEVATGEYLAFCDSDDWVEPDTYERMYTTASNTGADAVYTGIQTINDTGEVRPMNQHKYFEVMTEKRRILEFAMDMICSKAEDSVESHIAMSAKIVLYRRELIEKYCLKFESERKFISEDLIWNLDVLGHASVITTMPETFYYYYNNLSSISKCVRLDRFASFKTIREELMRRTSNMRFPQCVQERIDRMFLRYVRHDIGKILLSDTPISMRYKVAQTCMADYMTQNVLQSFPLYKLTKQQQIIMWLIKRKCIMVLYLLFQFDKYIRRCK